MIQKYRENPTLGFKTVTTITGETEYSKNCRKIRDRYYTINEDCFKIEERWYVKTSKQITFDYETKNWVIIKKFPLVYGIVDFKSNGSIPVFGYFTANKYNNVYVNIPNYGLVLAYTDEILKNNGYIENISDGQWFYKKTMSNAQIAACTKITSKKVFTQQGYNIEDNKEEFTQKVKLYDEYPAKIGASAVKYSRFLNGQSYGFEIETSKGYLPENVQSRHGIVICRDGSIENAEYVTVPMKGPKGLVNIKTLSEELRKRTEIDIKCSFHIHFGTLSSDRLFIVSLYALAIKIQDEIFKMFPYYKTEWKNIKKQNYNQKVRKLGITALNPKASKQEYAQYVDEAYYRIQTWLNEGEPPNDRFNRNNNQHVQTAKWNRKQRYYWINFINLFFSERRTIEFRLHHATRNGQKMINWLFICSAILQYAEANAKLILTNTKAITLNDILDYYADHYKNKDSQFLSEYLKAYVEDRKNYFLNDFKNNDYISQAEMDNDKKYTFEYKGVQWLF